MSAELPAGAGSGDRLKALRDAARLSQRALARKAGVDPETLARWESGVGPPRAATVRKVAAALGVPPTALGVEDAAADPPEDVPLELRGALALRGVVPGPGGYDAALLAAVAARGWRATVEERVPGVRGRHRYRALVFGSVGDGVPRHASGRGSGATEVEALAKALVRLLERAA